MKKLIKKKLDDRGAFSILALISILIGITVATGFISIMFKTMAINEIRGVMDSAGIIALRKNVDAEKWRAEILEIDMAGAKADFNTIVNGNLSSSVGGLLESYEIKSVNVYPPNHPNLATLGIDTGQRDQYYIESRVVAKYSNSTPMSNITSTSLNFYNIFQGGEDNITVAEGGDGTIIIRSVSRLVLR